MATTMYFDEKVKDLEKDVTLDIELGKSSFYGDTHLYIRVDDKTIIMDGKTEKEFFESIERLGFYLGHIGH